MEPACAVLEISPSTYYAAKRREENPSARDGRDEELKKAIMQAREKKGRADDADVGFEHRAAWCGEDDAIAS